MCTSPHLGNAPPPPWVLPIAKHEGNIIMNIKYVDHGEEEGRVLTATPTWRIGR